jgi:AcrR family transcriptional regulator
MTGEGSREAVPTRDRVVAEAMRLFGERGYAATTIAAIEAAAGLSPGSGALYKHFRSKAEILAEGIGRLIDAGAPLRALLGGTSEAPGTTELDRLPLRDRMAFVAEAGLHRLEQERDFNRILLRDLKDFPELLDRARNDEISTTHRGLTHWLATQAEAGPGDGDWEALAAVAQGATAHYWLLRDVFGGEHPTGVSEQRYVAALADLVAELLARHDTAGPAPAATASGSRSVTGSGSDSATDPGRDSATNSGTGTGTDSADGPAPAAAPGHGPDHPSEPGHGHHGRDHDHDHAQNPPRQGQLP